MTYILPTPERTIGNFESAVGGFDKLAQLLLQASMAQANARGTFLPKNIPNPNYGQQGQLKPNVSFSQPTQGMGVSARQNPQQIKQGILSAPPTYSTQPMLNSQQFKTLQDLQSYGKTQQEMDPLALAMERQIQEEKLRSQQLNNQFMQQFTPQIKQGQIDLSALRGQQLNQQIDPNNPLNVIMQAYANQALGQAGQAAQPSANTSSGLGSQEMSQLYELAVSGDEDAISVLRSMGEL